MEEDTPIEENNESEVNTMPSNETAQEKIKRSSYASFLNTGTKDLPTWTRMGKGITEMSLDYNPNDESEQYIHEDSATHELTGYAPESSVTQKCFKNEPIFEYVEAKRRARAIQADAETQRLDVFIYDKITDNVYAAELNEAILEITRFEGASIEYDVKLNGDPKVGYVTISDGTVTFKEGEYPG